MKYRKSTGVAVTLAACGLIAFSAANLESFTARAGQIVTIDNAVAGITIPLNNYYASSLNPVEMCIRDSDTPRQVYYNKKAVTASDSLIHLVKNAIPKPRRSIFS